MWGWPNGLPQFAELDALFTDFGGGSLFGTITMNEAEAEATPGVVPGQPGGKVWDIALNAAAIASLNAATNQWAVGGSLGSVTPPISTTTELLFGGLVPFSTHSGRDTPKPQLVLTTSILAGDFNDNGFVDAADYTLWRDNVGAPAGTLANDSVGGSIGPLQYDLWRTHFGQNAVRSFFVSVTNAIPEPATMLLILPSALAFLYLRRSSARS